MGKSLQHAAMALPRGYLFGLTLSTAGSSTTFTTAAGEAVDDTFVDLMTLGSSLAKTTGSWAVGAATGSLDTGTVAASTFYHVFLIKRIDTGVVDVLISLSATAPTMPTNYTIKRRIGSIKTNASSQWCMFYQNGDTFLWSDMQALEYNVTNPGTAAVTVGCTFGIPTGVRVEGIFNAFLNNSATAIAVGWLLSSMDISDTAPTSAATPLETLFENCAAVIGLGGQVRVWTNTSAQIRSRCSASDANTTIRLATVGYVDTRGKLY